MAVSLPTSPSANLSEARAWDAELEEVGGLGVQAQKGGYSITDRVRMRDKKSAMVGARGSVKRQSEIQREKKQSRQEEREEERLRKQSYYRKVTGISFFKYSPLPLSNFLQAYGKQRCR